MARFSSTELQAEISRILDRDPDLSQAGIIRALREGGFRGGNVRLRVLTDLARLPGGMGTQTDLLNLPLPRFGRERMAAVLRETGAQVPVDITDGTHIAISYEATYEARITLYGDFHSNASGTARGRIVQPIEQFDRELIDVRIEQQVYGQIISHIGDENESFIEGIEVDLLKFDVMVENAELRGTRATARIRAN